jgi:hypothetical protein
VFEVSDGLGGEVGRGDGTGVAVRAMNEADGEPCDGDWDVASFGHDAASLPLGLRLQGRFALGTDRQRERFGVRASVIYP